MPEDALITKPALPKKTADAAEKPSAAPAEKTFWQKAFSARTAGGSKVDIFKFIRYVYSLTIFIIVLILVWVMAFLYNNVYLTMAQAEIVTSLKSKVIEESIDFDKFNSIIGKIAGKKSLSAWPYSAHLTSPFAYGMRRAYPVNILPAAAEIATSTATTTPSND